LNILNKSSFDLSAALKINEIFYSIQGESTYAGLPCIFVRLSACNLRCTWCDTEYAFYEGKNITLEEILAEIKKHSCNLVEITGGEPLLQKNVLTLMEILCDNMYEVLLETGGHMDISEVDGRVKRIVDIKCPSSGESDKVFWKNIDYLTTADQLKFVAADREDYEWAREVIYENKLADKCVLIISPVYGRIDSSKLAGWILDDHLPVRMQLQLQKYIWPPDTRGV
jgi:7-carboxy-7-deazaguanine synthase